MPESLPAPLGLESRVGLRCADRLLELARAFHRGTVAPVRALLVEFMDRLESIGEDHEELYDTDVRERMGEVIDNLLISPTGSTEIPADMGMFSAEGNRRVVDALRHYLDRAVPRAEELGLDAAARSAAVWDGDAISAAGSSVDEFLGWRDPD